MDGFAAYMKSGDPDLKTELRKLAKHIQRIDETFRFDMDES